MKLYLRNIRMPLSSFTLTLDIELEGDVIALFGPSGSGKTSLLDLIAGLRRADSAFVRFNSSVWTDTELGRSLPACQRGIGYVPQDGSLFPHLSVRQNVLYGAKRESVSARFSLEHVSHVLEISELMNGGARTLSGGEKQRVAIARALLSQPRLLLLDEPLASLDVALKAKSSALLRRVREEFGIPMIYVSHSADEVAALCDMVMVIERGQMIRCGAPGKIFTEKTLPVLELR